MIIQLNVLVIEIISARLRLFTNVLASFLSVLQTIMITYNLLFNINTYNIPPGLYSALFFINPENLFTQTIPINLTVLDYLILLGDVNFDGSINVLDIVNIMGFIIETSEPTSLELEAADVNQDNTLDVLDIVTIINIILSE